MVSPASDLSAVHTRSLPRKLDAKSFRGDVSSKLQVRSASSPYTFNWFISYYEFAFHLEAKESGSKYSSSRCVLPVEAMVKRHLLVTLRHHWERTSPFGNERQFS